MSRDTLFFDDEDASSDDLPSYEESVQPPANNPTTVRSRGGSDPRPRPGVVSELPTRWTSSTQRRVISFRSRTDDETWTALLPTFPSLNTLTPAIAVLPVSPSPPASQPWTIPSVHSASASLSQDLPRPVDQPRFTFTSSTRPRVIASRRTTPTNPESDRPALPPPPVPALTLVDMSRRPEPRPTSTLRDQLKWISRGAKTALKRKRMVTPPAPAPNSSCVPVRAM